MVDAGESEENIATVIRGYAPAVEPAAQSADLSTPRPKASTLASAALGAAPLVEQAAARFGTNPNVPRIAGAIARHGTTAAVLGHAVSTGNIAEGLLAPSAGWRAGRGGYRLGRMAQSVARPVASIMGRLAPITKALGPAPVFQRLSELLQEEELRASQPHPPISPLPINAPAVAPEADPALKAFVAMSLRGRMMR